MMASAALVFALLATPSYARVSQFDSRRTAFIQTQRRQCSNRLLSINQPSSFGSPERRRNSATINYMTNYDGEDKEDINETPTERPDKNLPAFFDALLEIPDPRLLAGDLLFILIINFLLQIASDVGNPGFWHNGGFLQPVTMPTTLLAVIVRDSKMSIAWVIGAIWNRAYSSSSVSDDETAVKIALQIWVSYCSSRILLDLGESLLFTHSGIDIGMLGQEAWYTAIVMAFFRLAYGRFR